MGLGNFFSELVRFLQTSERQYAGANQQYTDYVVDRLAMCTRNVEVLKERLETSLEGADVEVQPVITQIFTRLNELSHALGQLSTKWQQHMDELEGRSSSAYQHLFNMLHTYVLVALDSVLRKSNLSIFISHGPR